MSKKATAKQHLEAAVGFIAIAEAADSSSVAYRKAAEEIDAAMNADAKLTQTAVAQQIGKSHNYVHKLLQALSRAREGAEFRVDWGSGSNKRADIARTVPTKHEDRVEMAAALLADPKVVEGVLAAPSTAQRHVENVVHEKERGRREKSRESERQRRTDEALPLPAYMAAMVIKVNEWAVGLAAITDDDLDALPPGRGRDLVGEAACELERQARRWVNRLNAAPELRVIEGQGSRRSA